MEKLTVETQHVLSEGEHLANLVKSDGWAVARRKLLERIIAIGDIFQLTDKENLKEELGARQIAIEILRDFLRDVEGSANQYKNNAEFFRQIQEDNYLHTQ